MYDAYSDYYKFFLRSDRVAEEVATIELVEEKKNLLPNESQAPSPSSQDPKWDLISLPFCVS